MQRQSSHAGRGVEGLSHRDENRAGRLEPLDELCKVGEGTGQSVDLVDHNLLDETDVDVGEQALRFGRVPSLTEYCCSDSSIRYDEGWFGPGRPSTAKRMTAKLNVLGRTAPSMQRH